MPKHKYLLLYHSYLDAIELLDDAERGRLFTACLLYSFSGSAPDLSGNERFVFPHIRAQIDRDIDSYNKTCDKNAKNARKRWDPSHRIHSHPSYANDNHTDTDNVIDTDNDINNDNNNAIDIDTCSLSLSLPFSEINASNVPPDNPEANAVWLIVLDSLKNHLSAAAINSWFDDCRAADFSNGRLSLFSPSSFKLNTIHNEFMPLINSITDELIADGSIS